MKFNRQSLRYLIIEPCDQDKTVVVIRNAHESTEPTFKFELNSDEIKRLLTALEEARDHLAEKSDVSIQARFGEWLDVPKKKT